MAYVPKYSAVAQVNPNGTVTVKQYANSTEARLAQDLARDSGKTSYYYYYPSKCKTTAAFVGPMNITR